MIFWPTPKRAEHANLRSRRRLARTLFTACVSASCLVVACVASTATAAAARNGALFAGGAGMAPYVASASGSAKLAANDTLPRPAWWHGQCDGNATYGNYPGSVPLGAVFDGLVACGRPAGDSNDALVRFFPGAWGEYEWECVELSMRWMYQAWGVEPYGADGYDVVRNYPDGTAGYPLLQVDRNGTAGVTPQPGDVLSMQDGSGFGHTEVVAWSSVNGSGNGTLRAITENYGNGNNGWIALSVQHWVVSSPGMVVTGWLHNPAWSLQMPVLWQVTSSGLLQVKDNGGLGGGFVTVASGIASASVVGGGGPRPAPLVAALTTTGTLLAGPLVPGAALHSVATGVSSFALSSGSGPGGHPLLGWVTSSGNFELASGSLTAAPHLEATGVARIALAPNAGPASALVGYVSDSGTFEVGEGAAAIGTTPRFTAVASGVSQIALAGAGPAANAVEAYVSGGGFYERQGSGAFTEIAGGVRQMSVAAVGPTATPLLAYVSRTGVLEARLGAGAFVPDGSGLASVSVAAGSTSAGFPLVAALSSSGHWSVQDGTLSSPWHPQAAATSVVASGASALTVS